MSSLFESEVYQRQRATPFTRISLTALMKELALEVAGDAAAEVTLSCKYRHSVPSRFWWTISWLGVDGEQHVCDGQELDKCLWRAAVDYAHYNNKLEKNWTHVKPLPPITDSRTCEERKEDGDCPDTKESDNESIKKD